MRVSDVNDLVQEKPTVFTTPLPLENRNLIKMSMNLFLSKILHWKDLPSDCTWCRLVYLSEN